MSDGDIFGIVAMILIVALFATFYGTKKMLDDWCE